ncbi:unnamed protein product [Diabrotica balteata]|uniref:Uncharacterized protein n=1 Tax=Diabrotica balteata TaxID=107213 RepID=A0A9N9T5G1_DIABA|nr:unnamed protein product [Diabrotica balteata]
MVKCYVWSILLYGMETWTLRVPFINKLEASEMWTLSRMVSNEEVLRKANTGRELLNFIKVQKIGYLGHILRGKKYEGEKKRSRSQTNVVATEHKKLDKHK